MSNEYLFIVGCARTGTTLLRRVLTRSPRLCVTPETHFLHRLSKRGKRGRRIKRFGDLTNDANALRLVDYMFQKLRRPVYYSWLQANMDRDEFAERLLATDRSERSIFTLMIEVFVEKNRQCPEEQLIRGEKTPSHRHYVPILLEWMPKAKIIQTIRDPRAMTISQLRKVWKTSVGWRQRLSFLPSRLVDPLDIPTEVMRMSLAWLGSIRQHDAYSRLYPDRYRMIRFEDLVLEPEPHIKELCEFLGMDFIPEMVSDVMVVGSSFEKEFQGPREFDAQVLERWRSDSIGPLVRSWYRLVAGRMLRRFGYAS
jgi:hypothetical protein